MSVRFYLVRHADAEPKAAGGDAARRLTRAARVAFAARAAALAPRLDLARIAASPLVRARETANLLAAATNAPVEELEALASGASGGRELLDLGRALGAGVALVGHNPEIAQAVAIAAGRDLEVRPGAVAAIDADAGYRLAWLDTP